MAGAPLHAVLTASTAVAHFPELGSEVSQTVRIVITPAWLHWAARPPADSASMARAAQANRSRGVRMRISVDPERQDFKWLRHVLHTFNILLPDAKKFGPRPPSFAILFLTEMPNATAAADPFKGLAKDLLLRMHELMVKGRVLEERFIKMSKSGDGFFWIGGPGEEAFNVPLGLQVKKGQGPEFDYLNLHYRSSSIALAMGVSPIDMLRQMRNVATDTFSKGRNFVNHYAIPEINIVPMSPTIETQYATAIGTGIANARTPGDGISIVNGGDGGTAEGDFHSCLVWANRPVLKLPILMIVTNNGYAISVPTKEEHGERRIADWGKVFEMPVKTINGNDPVESWFAVKEAMDYCRKERKPYLLESMVSRLYGHSSSSGANRIPEADCIALFEAKLIERKFASKENLEKIWQDTQAEIDAAHQKVKTEPFPAPETIWEDVFSGPLPDSYPTKGGS